MNDRLMQADRKHADEGSKIKAPQIGARVKPKPQSVEGEMRRHRVRGHGHEKKLRCRRQQEGGEEGVLSFVRPDVVRRAVKGEHGDGSEKRVEKKLEMHCLKERA